MKTISERHIYTTQLVELLADTVEGETITYDKMSELIGVDTRPSGLGYRYQHSARYILEKEAGIVFEVIDTVGLKHMPKEDVALSSVASLARPINSKVLRQRRRMNTLVDHYDQLSEDAKNTLNSARALALFLGKTCTHRGVKLIAGATQKSRKQISFDETIGLFDRKKTRCE